VETATALLERLRRADAQHQRLAAEGQRSGERIEEEVRRKCGDLE
jgi:hypothetical protein